MRIWEKNAVHPDFISVGCFPVKRTSPDKMIAGKRTFQDFFREQLFINRMIKDQYHLQDIPIYVTSWSSESPCTPRKNCFSCLKMNEEYREPGIEHVFTVRKFPPQVLQTQLLFKVITICVLFFDLILRIRFLLRNDFFRIRRWQQFFGWQCYLQLLQQ